MCVVDNSIIRAMGWWLNCGSGLLLFFFFFKFLLLDCYVCVIGLSIFLQFLKSVEKGGKMPVAKHGSGAFFPRFL